MGPLEVLKSNKDFRQVYTRGKSVADRNLVLYVFSKGNTGVRFGYSVSKKLGRAVVRNLIRRRLKEICRGHQHEIKEGYDLVIIARGPARDSDYSHLERSFLFLLKKSNLLINKEMKG